MLMLTIMAVLVVVAAVLIFGLRMRRRADAYIDALRGAGRPGRVDEILAQEERLALPELSNHVFFVRNAGESLEGLTGAERTFRLVDEVLLEVNNGGFLQYFENTAGHHAAEAVAALRAIGASRTAAVLSDAIAVFGPDGPAASHEARRAQVESLPAEAKAELSALDTRFFEEDDAAALQLPFVLRHRREFLDQ